MSEMDLDKAIAAANHDAYRREEGLYPQANGENDPIAVIIPDAKMFCPGCGYPMDTRVQRDVHRVLGCAKP